MTFRFEDQILVDGEQISAMKTEVLDKKSAKALELKSLAGHVKSHCITSTGKVFAEAHLLNPLVDKEQIKSKQDALRELRSNDKLREGIIGFLERVKHKRYYDQTIWFDQEKIVGHFFNKETDHSTLEITRSLLSELPSWMSELPVSESTHLRQLQNDVFGLNGSRAKDLSDNPVYRQFKKEVVAKRELKWHLPRVRYMHPFSPAMAGIFAGGITLYLLPFGENGELAAASTLMAGIVGSGVGKIIDELNKHYFVQPLRNYFRNAPEVTRAFSAIGSLDELIAQDSFGKSLGEYASLPEILEESQHHLVLEGLVNPLQYLHCKEGYVPNDISFGGGKQLVFLTGPNSGGKTSVSTAAQHAQILFQTGGYVPAKHAKMTIADRIYNQVVEQNRINDEEGGLGSQLRRSREILFNCSPHSFVIIDDLNEATTFEEKMGLTSDLLNGFLHTKSTVVYVSHLYQLAQQFREEGLGNYLQVEFNGVEPTHKIVPGISTKSHADLVAKRIGIDEKAIFAHLIEQGYLPANGSLKDTSKFRPAYK